MTEDTARNTDPAGVRIPANLRRNMDVVRLLVLAALALLVAVLSGLVSAAVALSLFAAVGLTALVLRRGAPTVKQEMAAVRSIWSEPIVRAVIDALPDPALVLDDKSVVRCVNSALKEEFGQIGLGEPFSFRLRIPALLATVEKAIAGNAPLEVEWSEKVPSTRWFKAYVAALRQPAAASAATADPARYFIVVIRDLSEQYRLDRMRADFVANASHELRTPL
ncbi:MAG: two-component sensor histidine kinase, partial [Hyphomicrobiales bacterium]|nr:two-component sensor histidine kinase [Hyphomicrobiales bacterium]